MLEGQLEGHLVTLLIKLGAIASLASVMIRFGAIKRLLMSEERSLAERFQLSLWLSAGFGASVALRAFSPNYQAADLGLEGSLLAGLLGGYVPGLLSGVLISLPAMWHGEFLSMPLLAGIGVLGGLLRDCAPEHEEIWRFSPFLDLSIYRFFRSTYDPRHTAFHLILIAAILFAEFLRQTIGGMARVQWVFYLQPQWHDPHWLAIAAVYCTTLIAVAMPLKIWNSSRTEHKLEEQRRLLIEARLEALKSQINPHFLFNTLNSVSALIRTDPARARVMVLKLSNILRRLLRKTENFTSLREEVSFIEDYLAIEMIRFGEKLRFEKQVDQDTLDMPMPSMLLQPLVENCIKHGLGSKVEGGTIHLRAWREAGRLHLLVEDDGVGISEDRLNDLQAGGIGVSNVSERLKVLFGGNYGFRIDSAPQRGTRVYIDLPELVTNLAAVS